MDSLICFILNRATTLQNTPSLPTINPTEIASLFFNGSIGKTADDTQIKQTLDVMKSLVKQGLLQQTDVNDDIPNANRFSITPNGKKFLESNCKQA